MSEDDTAGYSMIAVVISAIGGIVVAVVSVWAVSMLWGGSGAGLWEQLFRVSPSVKGGGIGTDWVTGNTIPALDLLISLTHAADVILGVFILILVFIHWASFRRLAGRMQESPGGRGEGVAADGGKRMEGSDDSQKRSIDGGKEE